MTAPTTRLPSRAVPRRIALVGGGRWGRVHAGVLARLLSPGDEILWVSRHNASAIAGLAAQAKVVTVTVVTDLADAIARRPDAAIVVTAPHTHAQTARDLLAAGISTLVEKPFVLDPQDGSQLIGAAQTRGLVVGVGLHLLMASYLKHFCSLWRHRAVAAVRLDWFDPEVETRYGEVKRPDPATPKVHDIYPHLWALLRVVLPERAPTVTAVECIGRGDARLHLTAGDMDIEARIGRRASARARRVAVQFCDGGTALLDFTREPGQPVIDGVAVEADPEWGCTDSPITAEVRSFLRAAEDAVVADNWPCAAQNVSDSVVGAAAAAAMLSASEARRLSELMRASHDPGSDPDISALLIDNLAPEMIQRGLRMDDPAAQESMVQAALATISSPLEAQQRAAVDPLHALFARSPFLRAVREGA